MSALLGLAHCTRAPATYRLEVLPARGTGGSDAYTAAATPVTGSLSVETIEHGKQLVVVQLAELPPPERMGPGLTEFVVWLEDNEGHHLKVGTLRYDRAHHSGNLLATTDLSAFTVQVTGERDENASAPSDVVLAQRKVSHN